MTRPTCSSKKSGWRNERGVAMEARRTVVTEPRPTSDTGAPQPPDQPRKTQRFLRGASPGAFGKSRLVWPDRSAGALGVGAHERHDLDDGWRQNTMVRFA